MHTKGRLVVIDGIDGSGKATQSRLLARRLRKEGKQVRHLEFPQYEKSFFGALLGEYLRGSFGDFVKVDPRIASVLYAADRFEAKEKMEKWLNAGCVVIADRYVSANQIHQGGKIGSAAKRKVFLQWLDRLEHRVFGMPRPHLVIYLDIPVSMSIELLTQSKKILAEKKKKYLRGRRDLAEGNRLYLEQSRRSALLLARENKNWEKVLCTERGQLFSKQKIHEAIWSIVGPLSS